MYLRRSIFISLFLLLLAPLWAASIHDVDQLIANYQLKEAESVLRTLLESDPEDPEVLKRLGIVLVLRTEEVSDEQKNAEMCRQAIAYLEKAKSLGMQDPLVDKLLRELPSEGGLGPTVFTKNQAANEAMNQAEKAFALRRYDEAVEFYEKAARLEPDLYHAPLYLGDAWLRQGDTAKACRAYDRAIAIEPDIETAYRYKGNALMKQGDVERALRSYASAVVAEPGSDMAWESGLQRWANATGAELRLPHIDPPVSLGEDGTTLNVNPQGESPELAPWLVYGASRVSWREKDYAERFPGQDYRHTLAEEVEALGNVVEVARELQEEGSLELDEDLALLVELKDQQLLEPFVLFCMADKEILNDYRPYREAHRDKMVEFLVEYGVQRERL